jgi:hypothetical protein
LVLWPEAWACSHAGACSRAAAAVAQKLRRDGWYGQVMIGEPLYLAARNICAEAYHEAGLYRSSGLALKDANSVRDLRL